MEFKKSAGLAAVFTVAMLVINYAFQFIFGNSIRSLFAVVSYPGAVPSPVSPVSTTIGGKLVSWMSGIIPGLDINTIVLLFLSSWVAIMIGGLLVEKLKLPTASGRTGKIMSVILWGTIPLYLLIVGTSVPSTGAIIGVVLYTFVASWVAAKLADIANVNI